MDKTAELIALQADLPRQVRAQQAMSAALAAWQTQSAVAGVLAAFRRYADGTALCELPELAGLFGEDAAPARALTDPLLAGLGSELGAEPFATVPLRHHFDGMISTLLLARQGETVLTLVTIDGAALGRRPRPTSACFVPAEEWEIVLAGTGRGRLVERRGAGLAEHRLDLAPGLSLGRQSEREALIFDEVDGALTLLRLQRRSAQLQPTKEISLIDGRMVHQAAGSPSESRHEVAVALLGRMGRKDAAPLLAEIARDESHGDSLRWQALRECLALDTGTGFWTLTAISRAGSDPLAVPAGAMRAQLLEAYPQLAEVDLCHA